jgi:hypothetical protein
MIFWNLEGAAYATSSFARMAGSYIAPGRGVAYRLPGIFAAWMAAR